MAWTTPATFSSGSVLTAASLNTDLRDNPNYLYGFTVQPPMAKSHKTGDIGIVTATWTSTQLDTQDWDTDTISNTGTGTFTIQTAGVYHILGTCRFDVNNTGRRMARLNYNSGTIVAQQEVGTPSTTLGCNLEVAGYMTCAVNDTFVLEVYQNSGGNLNILGSQPPVGYSLAVQWQGQP
jgi:hypothetical protein